MLFKNRNPNSSVDFQVFTGAAVGQDYQERLISDKLCKNTCWVFFSIFVRKQQLFPTPTSAEGIRLTQFTCQLCNVPCRGAAESSAAAVSLPPRRLRPQRPIHTSRHSRGICLARHSPEFSPGFSKHETKKVMDDGSARPAPQARTGAQKLYVVHNFQTWCRILYKAH